MREERYQMCIRDSCKEYPMSAPTEIGSYRGFRMEIYYDTVNAHYCMNLCGKAKHKKET